MAGLRGVSNARDVQSIVENVVNNPQFRSLITDVVETSSQSRPVCAGSQMTAERGSTAAGVIDVDNVATTSSHGSRTSHSSPVAEFNAIFRRGASTGQQGAGTVASFFPGIANYTARSRSRSTASSSRGRSTSTKVKPAASKTQNSIFSREVVLLNNPNASSVVRGKLKAELMRRGQVISSFDFNRSWSEEDVNRHLCLAFKDKLQSAR